MFDYEQHHYDKEKLRSTSTSIGLIMIDQDADLEQVRAMPPISEGLSSSISFIFCVCFFPLLYLFSLYFISKDVDFVQVWYTSFLYVYS